MKPCVIYFLLVRWQLQYGMCNTSLVQHCQAANHFQQFSSLELSAKGNIFWKCMWIATIWDLCNMKNRIIFKNATGDAEEIFCLAQIKAWTWLAHKFKKAYFSYPEWYLCPLICIRSVG